jgi:hypothetical protein
MYNSGAEFMNVQEQEEEKKASFYCKISLIYFGVFMGKTVVFNLKVIV